MTRERVVPAHAGTHTPRSRVLAQWQTASAPTNYGGYGSMLSQGRRGIVWHVLMSSFRGAKRRSNPLSPLFWLWIASRSLSSGAHSRDPLARKTRERVVPAHAGTHAPPSRGLAQ